MAGVVSSTFSIVYPPLSPASTFGTAVQLIVQTNLSPSQDINQSTIAVSDYQLKPTVQLSNLNNANQLSSLSGQPSTTVFTPPQNVAQPVVCQSNLNNATSAFS